MISYSHKNKAILFFIIFTILIGNIHVGSANEPEEIKYEVASFSNEIFYRGNNRLVKNEIDILTGKKNNFRAQAIFNIPISIPLGDNMIQQIEDVLTNIESFDEIPYLSKRTKKTTPLFKDISIHNDFINKDGNRTIIAKVTLPPFNAVIMQFEVIKDKNFIMFKAYNIDKLKYWIVPVINEQKMLILFAGELDGKVFKCYGLGVADTGSFFLFQKTIEEEFNSRTAAIITWFHALLRTMLSGS